MLFTQRVKKALMTDPVDFVVKRLPYDLSSHAGLALVWRLFKRIKPLAMIEPNYHGSWWHRQQRHPQVLPGPARPGQERL